MGLTIEHLPGRTGHRSCLQIENMLKQAAHELPARQYRALMPLHAAINTSGIYPPHEFTPKQAAAARDALLETAKRLDRHRDNHAAGWAEEARDYATAADTAARSGKPWRWS